MFGDCSGMQGMTKSGDFVSTPSESYTSETPTAKGLTTSGTTKIALREMESLDSARCLSRCSEKVTYRVGE